MKKLFSILAVLAILTSCSKSKDDVPGIPSKQLVQVKMDFGDNTDYSYDSKGRVIKVMSGDQEVTTEYGNNTVTQTTRQVSLNFTSSKITYNLDAKGRATNGTGFIQLDPALPKHDMQITETYDAAGYLTRIDIATNSGASSFYEYYWQGGNISEIKTFFNNQFDGKTKYYYPTQVANKINSSIGDAQYFIGAAFTGKLNLHLPEKTENYSKTGTLTSTVNHQYELDSEGYPVKRTVTGSGGNNIHYFIYKN
jgi:hypothetical protein